MIRVVHIADTHLDTPFRELPEAAARIRRQTIRDCLSRALDYAASTSARIVLLCGDLFDNSEATPGSLRLISDFAAAHPDTDLFISPGNHDCLYGASPYRTMARPANLHVFDSGEMERLDFADFTVYGLGCLHENSEASPLRGFHVEDDERLNIMCLHSQVQGFGGHKVYNPVSLEEIAVSGLDYLALGHVHAFSGILKSGDTFYAYPGTLVGRGFDETGDKGFIAGEIGKGVQQLAFEKSRCGVFSRLELDVTGAQTMVELLSRIGARFVGAPADSFVKLTLTGTRRADMLLNIPAIKHSLESFAFVKIADETRPARDYEDMLSEQTLTGMYLREVLSRGETDARIRDKALSLGLAALAGEELTGADDQ